MAPPATRNVVPSPEQALLNRYCIGCHNQRTRTANLALDTLNLTNVGAHPATWEKVVRKLRAGVMPPSGLPRPDEKAQDSFVAFLEGALDRTAAAHPNPGRTETFHRLNRSEYQNAIRDLLALDVDITDFLPADDASYGFDNIAGVLRVSPSLMERYLSAAKTISRLAVGSPLPAVDSDAYRVAPDGQQHDRARSPAVRHARRDDDPSPVSRSTATTTFASRCRGRTVCASRTSSRSRSTASSVKLFTLAPRQRGQGATGYEVENKLDARVPVKAGPHEVGVAFVRKPAALVEQVREPFQNPRVSGNDGGPGGPLPSVSVVTIIGPHNPAGPGDTPSRRRIFVCRPASAAAQPDCARRDHVHARAAGLPRPGRRRRRPGPPRLLQPGARGGR